MPDIGAVPPHDAGGLLAYIEQFLARSTAPLEPVAVPCGACKACCYHTPIEVYPIYERRENLAHLDLVDNPAGGLMLRLGPDGGCGHLGPAGCTVYEHRPLACRTYDCRIFSACGLKIRLTGGRTQPDWTFSTDALSDDLAATGLRAAAERYIENPANADAVFIEHVRQYSVDVLRRMLPLLSQISESLADETPDRCAGLLAAFEAALAAISGDPGCQP